MIDIESQIFTRLYDVLKDKYKGLTIDSVSNLSPASFPYVSVEQSDSYALPGTRTDSNNENHVVVVYEINVFANSGNKKSYCKEVIKTIDNELNSLGFTRNTLVPNLSANADIMRYFARYTAVVSKDNIIYKR